MNDIIEFKMNDKIEIFVNEILMFDPSNEEHKQTCESMAADIGKELRLKAMDMSDIIKKPLVYAHKAHDDSISVNLKSLHKQIESLNPVNALESSSLISKITSYIPFIPSSLDIYKRSLESGEKMIQSIVRSLKEGQSTLNTDNDSLRKDQRSLWKFGEELKESITFAQAIVDSMDQKLLMLEDEKKTVFIRERFLFPLTQRILDLQQQAAVFQQATMSIELIVSNNKELMRGVDRTLGVSISALQVATMTSFALSHQKEVLDNIDSVNKTTSDLLLQNSMTLKEQGVSIQQRASSTMLDMDNLKAAFANLNDSLIEVSTFRNRTLETMKTCTKEYEAFLLTTNQPVLLPVDHMKL